ncbi:MAG: hypothetical protein K0Q72_3058, partial [Armatimonadetes bacterium]|nr:hypothetical protein [Armatimonadota bacterium]
MSVQDQNDVSGRLAAAFARDGYVSGIRVADEAQAVWTRAEFDALEAVEGREKCQIGLLD